MKLIFKNLFLFLTSLYFSYAIYAEPDQRGMFWTGFELNGFLYEKNSKWNYNFMNQARLTYTPNVLEQYIIRSSIYYHLNPVLTIWGGYDFIPTRFPTSSSYFIEQRLWPQIQYTQLFKGYLDFSFRSRLELRWRSNQSKPGLWLRERVELGIIKLNKYNIDIDMFDELFFNLYNPGWAPSGVIDQNRIFLGLVFPISATTSFDLGYLNLYRPHGNPTYMDHVLFAAVSIDFTKGTAVPLETL